MRVVSLASGSKGNACLVEQDGVAVMIDCGLSCRELVGRMAEADLAPEAVAAVVFTHSHTDHINGLPVFHRHFPGAELFANLMTAESVAALLGMNATDFACFENEQPLDIGPFTVTPFPIPHDTSDPVGYLVQAGGLTYFHGTDIGMPLESIGRRLAAADWATLESNHDLVMLHQSGRPQSLIRRIEGPRGHLSNDQSCELVRRFASPKLQRLALAHLSKDCNDPKIAKGAMQATLLGMGRADVSLSVLSQDFIVEFKDESRS